ncbi:nitrilase-related carbon-nitrogen hydrolase [Alicyclobacillus dauci]|uniref:CN hydrolase domain-containing protein n=1 Tax=Alicyclobacillus dauci TaxID=1475485 RepID=A0ABY6YXS6_9BACL|nr:nitrilase-related carbon-nitrogen hydrolase [Alicyclobacillus dauci]WAH35212.1 hypothetical protein NZD86_12905 [Alicyclobacillus dauci]
MKIGVVQTKVKSGIEHVNENRVINGRMAETLFRQGAQIVVLPECANHQYMMSSRDEVTRFSEPLNGPSVRYWIELAQKHNGYVIAGMLEREGDDVFNTAVIAGPTGVVGHYRKIHLFDWEQNYLSPGNLGFPVFELEGMNARIGMLICYDLRFPEAVRSLMFMGADAILVPTTWTSIGKSVLWDAQGYCLANYTAIAHAYCNKLPMVCADRAGHEGDVQFLGASLIVDQNAMVIAGPCSGEEAACLLADIDLQASRSKQVGRMNNLVADRRPGFYKHLV